MVFKDETFWLSQSGMAELFDCSADNISLHLKNIYDEEELTPEATTEKISVVRQESFVLNDELMKNGPFFGRDHFDELLERIREIRASERQPIRKSQMFLSSAATTMTKVATPPRPSTPSYRTSSTSPSRERRRQS